MRRSTPALPLALGLLALCLATLACGGPGRPAHILVLDVKIEQPDGMQTIRAATLLLDGKEVARFAQPHAEVSVVFSRQLGDVAPGKHVIDVRVDEQTVSPTQYTAGGFATYDGRQHPLFGTGGNLAAGQAVRFELEL